METVNQVTFSSEEPSPERLTEAEVLESVALGRILEEVRNDEPSEPHAYNRMHNRHNR